MKRATKCLVLAAGAGRRLRAKAQSKPLARLLGLPLIERVIRTARQAGLRDFYLVTGYQGAGLRQALGDGRRWGVQLHYLANPHWQQGNGSSVLAAQDLLEEPFLLLMGDHLFDPQIITELEDASLDGADLLLAVDRAPAGYCDLDDATKVRLQGDRIVDIGKELPSYDAFDTGIFLCSPRIFPALAATLPEDGSLSAGVRRLAQAGRAKALEVKGRFWLDVDTPQALRAAEAALLDQLKKPTDGPVSRYLNRPFSLQLSRWLVRSRRLRPNHLSLLSFGLALLGALLMALPGYAALAAGGLLAQIASISDGCDGEIARLKFQASEFGGWLDAVLDRYADGLLIGGLSYHLWLIAPSAASWLWALAALSGVLLNSYTADKYDQFLKKRLEQGRRPLRLGRDLRLLLLSLGALLNLPFFTLVTLALLNHLEVLRRIIWLSRQS
ncbi:MAG TPA: hypothetical protein ENI60_06185 [Candidatus Fraserbacteria bacterium]|nr:hypothetical protein [Candidatus Fraserbacteria bacterium]